MTEIRLATLDADRRTLLAVAHAANASKQPLAHYQALRLGVPRHPDTAWWLLEEDGEAVSGLLCYPLRLAEGDRVVSGHGLGGVVTRPEARGRGHATALCRHAVEDAERGGAEVGLLFSAIAPAFYERLGYRVAPAWHHVCARPADLARSGRGADLLPVDPRRHVDLLLDLYARAHPGLRMHRDEADWRAALLRGPHDLFFAVGSPPRGYVRLDPSESDAIEVVELMVPPDERAATLRAVAALAAGIGRGRLEGWFDPVPGLEGHLEDEGRPTTLPMLRGTDEVATARFWGSDYF